MGSNYSDLFYACLVSDVKSAKKLLKSGTDPKTALYAYDFSDFEKYWFSHYSLSKRERHQYYTHNYSSYTPTFLIDLVLEKKCPGYEEIIGLLLDYGAVFHKTVEIDAREPIAEVLIKRKIVYVSSVDEEVYDLDTLKLFVGNLHLRKHDKLIYKSLELNKPVDHIDFIIERQAPITEECFAYMDRYPSLSEKTNDEKVLSRGIDILLITSKTKIMDRKTNLIFAEKCLRRLRDLHKHYVKNENSLATILKENDYDKTVFLTKLGYNPNLYYDGICPLLYSIVNGLTNGVRALLDNKGNVNLFSKDSKSLLELAGNNSEIIQLLIQRGAKVKIETDPKDYIQAIKDCDIKKIKDLVKKGVDFRTKLENKTGLQHALETKNTEVVDIVSRINLGMNIDDIENEMKETSDERENEDIESEQEEEGPGVDFPKIPSAPIIQTVSQKEEILMS